MSLVTRFDSGCHVIFTNQQLQLWETTNSGPVVSVNTHMVLNIVHTVITEMSEKAEKKHLKVK